ncbi:unnamed protein product [Dracunculus medinensis]|uniref:HTH OST-type domain-containing protein n=1 Tax=Dracunculus medinensis TaxID=318479 RepID=A0A0N4U1G0_DRAME|nr:unnamed protein product [Dracunculus medinensis]
MFAQQTNIIRIDVIRNLSHILNDIWARVGPITISTLRKVYFTAYGVDLDKHCELGGFTLIEILEDKFNNEFYFNRELSVLEPRFVGNVFIASQNIQPFSDVPTSVVNYGSNFSLPPPGQPLFQSVVPMPPYQLFSPSYRVIPKLPNFVPPSLNYSTKNNGQFVSNTTRKSMNRVDIFNSLRDIIIDILNLPEHKRGITEKELMEAVRQRDSNIPLQLINFQTFFSNFMSDFIEKSGNLYRRRQSQIIIQEENIGDEEIPVNVKNAESIKNAATEECSKHNDCAVSPMEKCEESGKLVLQKSAKVNGEDPNDNNISVIDTVYDCTELLLDWRKNANSLQSLFEFLLVVNANYKENSGRFSDREFYDRFGNALFDRFNIFDLSDLVNSDLLKVERSNGELFYFVNSEIEYLTSADFIHLKKQLLHRFSIDSSVNFDTLLRLLKFPEEKYKSDLDKAAMLWAVLSRLPSDFDIQAVSRTSDLSELRINICPLPYEILLFDKLDYRHCSNLRNVQVNPEYQNMML